MKKILGILSCYFLFSCGNSDTVEISKAEYAELKGENLQMYATKLGTFDITFKVVEIDSCEYIYTWENNSSALFTHKGNCKFCAKIDFKKQ